jgi:hypothetical protein
MVRFELGVLMSFRKTIYATAALSFAALASAGMARAADLPVKAVKPVKDIPFFLVIDDRISFSYIFKGTDPGVFTRNANGSFNSTTAKQVYSFTHFDVWGYGTNFFTVNLFKSDHNDPANGCTALTSGNCAGASEVYGLFRSTFGWNEIFGTKAFSMGPLHNISFEVGADAEVENNALAPAKRDVVAGLQFAFDLPYKGFFNVAPLAYKEINHFSFNECGNNGGLPPGIPGVTCTIDGDASYHVTWAVEMNYYMDLGFLPENMQYFAVSGRVGFYGPKGNENSPLNVLTPGLQSFGLPTKTEINSEPIRLTFDASKAAWGAKYTHFVDVWVSYRYWQNKFGLDHANSPTCTVGGPGTASTGSCTEQSAQAGITVKF